MDAAPRFHWAEEAMPAAPFHNSDDYARCLNNKYTYNFRTGKIFNEIWMHK